MQRQVPHTSSSESVSVVTLEASLNPNMEDVPSDHVYRTASSKVVSHSVQETIGIPDPVATDWVDYGAQKEGVDKVLMDAKESRS